MEPRGGGRSAAASHPVLDLFFLARPPVLARAVACGLALAAAAAWGIIALRLHDHYAALRAEGAGLGPLPGLFADASSPFTASTGWAAAILFAVSVGRMRRVGPEPPVSVRDPTKLSITALRAGLRREYTASRIALVIVAMVTLLDLARLAVAAVAAIARFDAATRGLGWMVVEVAGLLLATLALTLWAREFRAQLDQLGAL